jgi:hypothetical protein
MSRSTGAELSVRPPVYLEPAKATLFSVDSRPVVRITESQHF